MCVIIQRQANVELPFDKLELACSINADGFGLTVLKKGKLITHRKASFSYKNDPKEIKDLLDQYKTQPLWLHLRHATCGPVTEDNAHPFPILNKKQDGVDMQFMHNGTIAGFFDSKEGDLSDTRQFAKQILIPTAKRFIRHMRRGQSVLDDPLFQKLIEKFADTNSVFALFDNVGNFRIFNYGKGKAFEGWWASNTYSFQESHYRNRRYTPSSTDYSEWGEFGTPWWEAEGRQASKWADQRQHANATWWNRELDKREQKSNSNVIPFKDMPLLSLSHCKAREIVDFIRSKGVPTMDKLQKLEERKPTFESLAGASLKTSELAMLNQSDLEGLCKKFPTEMGILFFDLLRKIRVTERAKEEINQRAEQIAENPQVM